MECVSVCVWVLVINGKTIAQQTNKMGMSRCNEQKFNMNYNKIYAQEKSTINRVTISQILCVSVPELLRYKMLIMSI